jgi:Cu/Ag efflux pump CusA
MSVLARWVVGPRLLGVPGVANVAIWGNRDRQLQVQVDPEQLRAQGVSLQQVIETTGNALWVSSLTYLEASTPGTGGFIDTPNQRIGIWHVLPISSPQELAEVPVEGANGMTLADVAKVVEDHQPLIGNGLADGGSNLMLVVEKLPGVNTLEVTKGVEEALDALQPGMSGITFDTSLFRPASFIEMAVNSFTNSLLIAAVLVMAGLLLLLWGWRSALIAAITIPVSLMAALFVLYLRGETVNIMVLAGLAVAIGAVIDDAIVDVENISRRLRRYRQEGSTRSTASIILEAAFEIRSALFFATLILLLAVLPLFFVGGVSGTFFQPLTVSYVVAVVASMLTAMIITPGLSMIFFSERVRAEHVRAEPVRPATPARRSGSPILLPLQRGYERVLKGGLSRGMGIVALALLATALVFIAAGLGASSGFGQRSLLPTIKEPYILVNWEGAPGTSEPEMDRIVSRATQELRAIPGVRDVGAHVGRAVYGDQVVGINSAQIWVSIDPAANYHATMAAIQQTVDGYPGLAHEVTGNLQQILKQSLPGISGVPPSEDISVRVYGENFDTLRGVAEQVKSSLSGIQGVSDLQLKLPVEEPTLEIEVDLAAAQRYGIKPGDVRRTAATLLSGLQVGSLFEQQKIFDVVVWGTPDIRNSLSDVRDLLLETSDGGHVRLEEVADVRVAPAPTVIRRSGISPYLDVAFNVNGRNLNAVLGDVKTALRGIKYPLEYHTEVLGNYIERQAAQQRILTAVIVAVIGIFLFLQAVSGSWRLALLSLLTLPAALSGSVLVMFLTSLFGGGGLISPGALIGLITVFGIAVRNSVLLVRHYQELEDEEGIEFGPDLVLRGASERAAPILTTALTTALALLPFVIFGGRPGHEILFSMAVIVMAGLVTSPLLNLFVMPALYLRFGAIREADLGLLPDRSADALTGDALAGD